MGLLGRESADIPEDGIPRHGAGDAVQWKVLGARCRMNYIHSNHPQPPHNNTYTPYHTASSCNATPLIHSHHHTIHSHLPANNVSAGVTPKLRSKIERIHTQVTRQAVQDAITRQRRRRPSRTRCWLRIWAQGHGE